MSIYVHVSYDNRSKSLGSFVVHSCSVSCIIDFSFFHFFQRERERLRVYTTYFPLPPPFFFPFFPFFFFFTE
ncbi:hypothetical protein EV426DRAFT_585188 [Tirmania nivea]|nr:hypothetical protein EV426DRAFT_585188 [Tirmania nivea]